MKRDTRKERDTPVAVEWIKQESNSDCGPAALVSLLRYHGESTTLRQVSRECPPRGGTVSLLRLVRSARRHGYRALAIRVVPTALEAIRLPALVTLRRPRVRGHYVVVESVSRAVVNVVDPGMGPRAMRRTVFDRLFEGVVCVLVPEDAGRGGGSSARRGRP